MYIPRLSVGNHCRHESQPVTEKSGQVRGFLEILALREVRLEERAGKNHSRPQSQGRLETQDLKSQILELTVISDSKGSWRIL